MKYIVFFKPLIGKPKFIGSFNTREEAENCLWKFHHENNLKRHWYLFNGCYISVRE